MQFMRMNFSINGKLPQGPERRTPESIEQDMLDQANAFFQAGSRCSADFSLSPNVENSLSAPAAICYAFAAEIYLKLLLHLAHPAERRGHKLIELFDVLPKDFITIAAKHYGTSEATLRGDVEAHSNVFAEWRYLYERREAQMSMTVLMRICTCLHRTIRELHPNIGVTFENRLAI